MDFALAWKRLPLPAPYLAVLLGAIVLFEIAPYLEDWGRGMRIRCRNEAAYRHTGPGG